MAASIMLRLDFTESLILDEALTHYAVDQQYRAEREADGRPRELWARLADELRHTVNRAGTPHSGKERVVPLTITGDRMHILTAALDSWARRQEVEATATDDDPGNLEEAANIARALLLRISGLIIDGHHIDGHHIDGHHIDGHHTDGRS